MNRAFSAPDFGCTNPGALPQATNEVRRWRKGRGLVNYRSELIWQRVLTLNTTKQGLGMRMKKTMLSNRRYNTAIAS